MDIVVLVNGIWAIAIIAIATIISLVLNYGNEGKRERYK